VGPWCQSLWTTKNCAIYVDNVHGAAIGWVLDVRLSEQETCATLSYFLQRHCWLLGCSFRTRPWNLNF
jgi:hypothetical protein